MWRTFDDRQDKPIRLMVHREGFPILDFGVPYFGIGEIGNLYLVFNCQLPVTNLNVHAQFLLPLHERKLGACPKRPKRDDLPSWGRCTAEQQSPRW